MSIRIPAALAAICLSATAVIAQDVQPTAPAAPAKEKKVCRSMIPTGSIMGKRVCLTKTEWARVNAQNEKDAELLRDKRSHGVQPTAM